MGNTKELLEKIKENFEAEEEEIERGNWAKVEELIEKNSKLFSKVSEFELDKGEELILKELFEKGKSIAKKIEEKVEILKKKIAVTQNISKNLDNLFTQTENTPFFIDEKK